MHHSTDTIAHTTAFVTPVMEHWVEREIAQSSQCVHHKGSFQRPFVPRVNTLPWSYVLHFKIKSNLLNTVMSEKIKRRGSPFDPTFQS